MRNLWQGFRAWRKKLQASLPYIRRKRHLKTVNKLSLQMQAIEERAANEKDALSRVLLSLPDTLAIKAPITQVIPIRDNEVNELCLFVTYSPDPQLKQYVIEHVHALVDAKIAVVLIVNTSHCASSFEFSPSLISKLHGLLVRQNIGFDFAAWGHAFYLLPPQTMKQRLYLVNDSIVGPLDKFTYYTMLDHIRRSEADMIGLTQNTWPRPHLQSFFLVFNQRLLRADFFQRVMANLLNLPSKKAAIDMYEIQLTQYIEEQGFRCHALFPNLAQCGDSPDDTIFRWARLIESGFPFVKASVLRISHDSADAARLVPERYRREISASPHRSQAE